MSARVALAAVFALMMVAGALTGSVAASSVEGPASPLPFSGVFTIWANGTVSSILAPIVEVGNVFTLTERMNGVIIDDLNGSTINGDDYDLNASTVWDFGTAVLVNAAVGVTVEDVHVTNATIGVDVYDSQDVNITGNNLTSPATSSSPAISYGVDVFGSTSVSVFENRLNGSTYAVEAEETQGALTIVDNDAAHSGGILVSGADTVRVAGNNLSATSFSTDYNIEAEDANSVSVVANNLTYSGASVATIYLYEDGPIWILNNTVVGTDSSYDIYADEAGSMVIEGNNLSSAHEYNAYGAYVGAFTFNDNSLFTGTGVYVDEASSVTALDNRGADLTYGVGAEYVKNMTVEGNSLYAATYPVDAEYVSAAFVSDNEFPASEYGVYWEYDGNLTETNNNLNFGDYGAYIEYSGSAVVDNNTAIYLGDYGIYGYYSGEITAWGNDFAHADYGLYIEYCSGFVATDNDLSSAKAYALYSYGNGPETLIGDDLSGSDTTYGAELEYDNGIDWQYSTDTDSAEYAIYAEYDNNILIAHSDLSNSADYGFYADYVNNVTLVDDSLNTTPYYGIYIDGGTDVRVIDTYLGGDESDEALYLDGVSGALLQGDVVSNTLWAYPVYLTDVTNLLADNDTFSGSLEYGIYLDDVTDSNFTDIDATGLDADHSSEYGLEISDCSDLSLVNVDVANAGYYGIYLYESEDVTLDHVNADDAYYYPIYEDDSSNITVLNSDFSGSYYGLWVVSSTDSTYVGDNFTSDEYAYVIDAVDSSTFYHNNFADDIYPYIVGSNVGNAWDAGYPQGGNYWGGLYTGVDLYGGAGQNIPGADGIGDTPYDLSATNVDQYPLMSPWVSTAVIFTETGLASGTSWSVTLNGVTFASTSSVISIPEDDGAFTAYSYTINVPSGYLASPASGSGTEADASIAVPVAFTPTTAAVFQDTGLPSGTSFSVTVNGQTLGSTTGSVSFSLPQGGYTYTVGPVPGFTTTWTGSFTVTPTGATVTVAFTPFESPVTFTESGLIAGASWTLHVGASTVSSTSSGQVVDLSNGTWAYSATGPAGYAAPTGTISVSGPASINVQFSVETYSVTFVESGLPAGTAWSITLNAVLQTGSTSSLQFTVANGTYAYGVAPIAGYQVVSSGAVVVAGSNPTVAVAFSPVTYALTFAETGLPASTSWNITVNGATVSSTSSAVTLLEAPGTYTYSAGHVAGYAAPPSGTVTVGAQATTVDLEYTAEAYPATFSEVGLAPGTTWGIEVGSQTLSSSGTSASTFLANGTYTYALTSVEGFTATPPQGTVTVEGSPVTIVVDYSPITYAITFAETGLTASTLWSVTVAGVTSSSTQSAIVVDEPAGTYNYTLGSIRGFTAPSGGEVSLVNKSVVVAVSFTASSEGYPVTFTESGLAHGASWSVEVNGQTLTSTTSQLSTTLPNGNYTYDVVAVTGFTSTPSQGVVEVLGGSGSVAVVFSSTSASSSQGSSTGPSDGELDAVIALVVVFALLAAFGWLLYLRATSRAPGSVAGPGKAEAAGPKDPPSSTTSKAVETNDSEGGASASSGSKP